MPNPRTSRRNPPRRTVSPTRRGLHAFGLMLQILGALTFATSCAGFACAGRAEVEGFGQQGDPFAWWGAGVVGIGMAIAGSFTRTLAARGIAGSGLVLDPERARRDLEPWARAGGGMLGDALDESGLTGPPTPLIRIRCRACTRTNEEDARFCSACGKEL